MSYQRYSQALLSTGHPVMYLFVHRPQLHLVGGVGRWILAFVAAALLLFVIRRSLNLGRVMDGLRDVAVFPLMVLLPSFSRKPITDVLHTDEPALPCRFQRPPPFLLS